MGATVYTRHPHQVLPAEVTAWLQATRDRRAGANHAFTAALVMVRDADWGIPAIAAALGMDARAVARRVARGRHQALPRLAFTVPRAPVPAIHHPGSRLPDLPAELAATLRRLSPVAAQHRAHHPADDPRTVAARQMNVQVVELLLRGYRPAQLARAAGLTRTAIDQRLRVLGLRYRDLRPDTRG